MQLASTCETEPAMVPLHLLVRGPRYWAGMHPQAANSWKVRMVPRRVHGSAQEHRSGFPRSLREHGAPAEGSRSAGSSWEKGSSDHYAHWQKVGAASRRLAQ